MEKSSEIKIWDLRTSEQLFILNRRSEDEDKRITINKIGLIDNGKTLFAHSNNNCFFWNLGNSLKKMKFERKNLIYSSIQVILDKSHLFFKPRKESILYKINLRNDMQVEKRVKFPEKIRSFKFVNKGDAMFLHKNRSKTIYT